MTVMIKYGWYFYLFVFFIWLRLTVTAFNEAFWHTQWSPLLLSHFFMAHGLVSEAGMVFEEIGTPDEVSGNSLISRGNTGYIDCGKRVFQSMSIEAEEEHVHCMVRLLAEGGTFDEAKQFIRSSPKKYEESLWQALLVCCKNSNELAKGLMIDEKIRTPELPCKPPMLVSLSQIFAAVGRWDQVEELSGEMKKIT